VIWYTETYQNLTAVHSDRTPVYQVTKIISASLSIERSDHVIELSLVPSVNLHVSSGNTADWIRMPFGVVSGVGLSMGVLDFGGDC